MVSSCVAFLKVQTTHIAEELGLPHLCSYSGLHPQSYHKQPLHEFPVIPTQAGIQNPLLQLPASEELPKTIKSFPGSFMNKRLWMSWPRGKVTPGAAIQRNYPQVTLWMEDHLPISDQATSQRRWKRGQEHHHLDQCGCWSMWPKSDSENGGKVAQFGQLNCLWRVTNIKWEFGLVMKMPHNWSNWLFAGCAKRHGPQNKYTLFFWPIWVSRVL